MVRLTDGSAHAEESRAQRAFRASALGFVATRGGCPPAGTSALSAATTQWSVTGALVTVGSRCGTALALSTLPERNDEIARSAAAAPVLARFGR